jgi:signal transduction histidine kinase
MKFFNCGSRIFFAISFLLFLLSIAPVSIDAQNVANVRYNRQAVRDSLLNVYKRGGKMPYKQRIKIALDIYDLADNDSLRGIIAKDMYKLSKENNDYHIQIESIKDIEQLEDPTQFDCLELIEKIPASDEQKDVKQFIRYRENAKVNDYTDEKVKAAHISNLIKEYEEGRGGDIYQRCGDLLILCYNLSYYSKGDLYGRYLKDLGKMIDKLPRYSGVSLISNTYYSVAALYYFKQKQNKEALAADMHLLKIEDNMEAYYKSVGRIYKNMDRFRYVSYRRMLTYSNVLSREQIDAIFQKIKILAARQDDINDDFYNTPIARSRYYFATKQYDILIPILDSALKKKIPDKGFLREALKNRLVAGEAVGDKNMQDYAIQYVACLEEMQQESVAEKSKELQVLYDFNNLKQAATMKILYISFAALFVVVILLILALYLLRRSRKLSARLSRAMRNLNLAKERAVSANKMKTVFLQNMNHEIRTPLNAINGFSRLIVEEGDTLSSEEKSEYMQLVTKNSDLMLSMISDVVDVAEMEAGDVKYTLMPYSLNEICSFVVSSVKNRAAQGVQMIFTPHPEDFTLVTDRNRLSQVLINFLTNACKFTKQGSITVEYSFESEGAVTFSVTDTGREIPADKADVIFRRFAKLDRFVQGSGLGLHICALIAKGLHAEVKLDTSYHGGARFLFIHPINKN